MAGKVQGAVYIDIEEKGEWLYSEIQFIDGHVPSREGEKEKQRDQRKIIN